MRDYSLSQVKSRPARSGDRLVLTAFQDTTTRGFTAIGDPRTAVCLLPGTQLAFEADVAYERWLPLLGIGRSSVRVVSFAQRSPRRAATHHDALEFPNGKTVLVTRLCAGQIATVLQLPAGAKPARTALVSSAEERVHAARR